LTYLFLQSLSSTLITYKDPKCVSKYDKLFPSYTQLKFTVISAIYTC